jgi:glucosamine-6-phosphate deaminase
MRKMTGVGNLTFQVATDVAEVATSVATKLIEVVAEKPEAVLMLPTGETARSLYEDLVARSIAKAVDFSQVQVVALDEYVGLVDNSPDSFRSFLQLFLCEPLSIPETSLHSPKANTADPGAEADAYQAVVESLGLPDVAVVGVGVNGHIAFNEPGTSWEKKTHVGTLTPETRAANAKFFGGDQSRVPKTAITVGLTTVASAKRVFVVATGAQKTNALRALWLGERTVATPVSFLSDHPGVEIFVDEDLASGL